MSASESKGHQILFRPLLSSLAHFTQLQPFFDHLILNSVTLLQGINMCHFFVCLQCPRSGVTNVFRKLYEHKEPVFLHKFRCQGCGSDTKRYRMRHDRNSTNKVFWLEAPIKLAAHIPKVLRQMKCNVVVGN